jgi:hypothetical protein
VRRDYYFITSRLGLLALGKIVINEDSQPGVLFARLGLWGRPDQFCVPPHIRITYYTRSSASAAQEKWSNIDQAIGIVDDDI